MQQVGRYQVLGEIGRGAMGIVYQALDPAIGRTVAIKTIRLRDLTDPSERDRLRERLFREAQSAGVLSHPGIVTIYDILESDGLAYIFMEFVNGPPLEKLLAADPPLDRETFLSILRQCAVALDYAHKRGIVHRDIKPGNIMIHEDGAAKITDFGVAKIMSQQMTQAGMMMGTPSYMSPEQVQGGAISGRADQWALAVIAYEILTGEKPFAAEHLPTLLFKILRDDPVPPQRWNTTLPAEAEPVLRRALSKLAEDRYENCADFVSALAGALNENPDWVPLPRGASGDLPTVAQSTSRHSTTMQETLPAAPLVLLPATTSEPPPLPVATTPPVWEPRRREEPPHRILPYFIAALLLLTASGGALYWLYLTPAAPPVTSVEAVPETGSPIPEPPPAPVESSVATASAAVQQEAPQPEPPKPAPPPVPTPASPVEFALASNPEGAIAVFDNDPRTACTTPCSVPLAPGRHTFTVRNEGYRPTQRIVTVPETKEATVELSPMVGTLALTTTPPGLTFLIDGKQHPAKTPVNIVLPAGPHRITVVRGSQRQDVNVQISDGAMTAQTVQWQ